jgi:hypothetical protein
MSDEPKKRSRAWLWPIALITSLTIYPLLYGPSIWLVGSGDSHELLEIHSTIFAPLRWARDRSETINRAFFWYGGVWVPPAPDDPDD